MNATKTTTRKKTNPGNKVNPDSRNLSGNGHNNSRIPSFSPEDIDQLMVEQQNLIDLFIKLSDNQLTDAERRRKIKSGIRNYGFLDKTSDLAMAFPQYDPPMFSSEDLKDAVRDIEFCRNLLAMLNEYIRIISNSLFFYSDEAFRMALRYYHSVRELARTGDPGARVVFNMLQPFFRRQRRSGEPGEPTEPEVERDVKALLHGKKDGKIVIEHEKPHMVGGKHVVFDEIHKDRESFRSVENKDMRVEN